MCTVLTAMLGMMREMQFGWSASSAPAVGKERHSTLDAVHYEVAERLRVGVVMWEYSLVFQLNNKYSGSNT